MKNFKNSIMATIIAVMCIDQQVQAAVVNSTTKPLGVKIYVDGRNYLLTTIQPNGRWDLETWRRNDAVRITVLDGRREVVSRPIIPFWKQNWETITIKEENGTFKVLQLNNKD